MKTNAFDPLVGKFNDPLAEERHKSIDDAREVEINMRGDAKYPPSYKGRETAAYGIVSHETYDKDMLRLYDTLEKERTGRFKNRYIIDHNFHAQDLKGDHIRETRQLNRVAPERYEEQKRRGLWYHWWQRLWSLEPKKSICMKLFLKKDWHHGKKQLWDLRVITNFLNSLHTFLHPLEKSRLFVLQSLKNPVALLNFAKQHLQRQFEVSPALNVHDVHQWDQVRKDYLRQHHQSFRLSPGGSAYSRPRAWIHELCKKSFAFCKFQLWHQIRNSRMKYFYFRLRCSIGQTTFTKSILFIHERSKNHDMATRATLTTTSAQLRSICNHGQLQCPKTARWPNADATKDL